MAKKPSFYRITLSIPANLKRRMDEVKEDVNWSALAAKAFDNHMAKIDEAKKYVAAESSGVSWVAW